MLFVCRPADLVRAKSAVLHQYWHEINSSTEMQGKLYCTMSVRATEMAGIATALNTWAAAHLRTIALASPRIPLSLESPLVLRVSRPARPPRADRGLLWLPASWAAAFVLEMREYVAAAQLVPGPSGTLLALFVPTPHSQIQVQAAAEHRGLSVAGGLQAPSIEFVLECGADVPTWPAALAAFGAAVKAVAGPTVVELPPRSHVVKARVGAQADRLAAALQAAGRREGESWSFAGHPLRLPAVAATGAQAARQAWQALRAA